MTGYIVFAHGSSVESANEAVRAVAAQFKEHGGHEVVEAAFLEGGRPDLRSAVEALSARGITSVIVIPYFLTLGLHLQRDLPCLIKEIEIEYPGLSVEVTRPLDGHPALIEALLDRARGTCKQD
jgi:sirohydrochlorin ferrochelatase